MKLLLTVILFLTLQQASAHPTGNLVVMGRQVFWSYTDPVDDADHHACIMQWSPEKGPSVLLRSTHEASDFMLYARQDILYAIERRYHSSTEKYEFRMLSIRIGAPPVVIIDWTEDTLRIGEGGFYTEATGGLVFASYPNILRWSASVGMEKAFEFPHPVKRLRKVGDDRLLLLGNNRCWLTDLAGKILLEWTGLTDPGVRNAPLNRNQVFDIDYKDSELLLAYWGKRSFEVVTEVERKKVLLQQKAPLVPHWVAWRGNDALLFSSEMDFTNGQNPRPLLLLLTSEGRVKTLWESENKP